MATAILVDGGFFIKRYRKLYENGMNHTPSQVADNIYKSLQKHLHGKNGKRRCDLYRILFYDCPPLTKKAHNPVTGKSVDFGKSREAIFRLAFHDELKKLRKVALRLGHLSQNADWIIPPHKTKALLKREITVDDLAEFDVIYETRQKGVDMKIGLDIASLAFKRQVDQIILVAGDSDFVPAAKLARREGIDFILDPMWNPINPDLHEHIDGLKSTWPRPQPHKKNAATE